MEFKIGDKVEIYAVMDGFWHKGIIKFIDNDTLGCFYCVECDIGQRWVDPIDIKLLGDW